MEDEVGEKISWNGYTMQHGVAMPYAHLPATLRADISMEEWHRFDPRFNTLEGLKILFCDKIQEEELGGQERYHWFFGQIIFSDRNRSKKHEAIWARDSAFDDPAPEVVLLRKANMITRLPTEELQLRRNLWMPLRHEKRDAWVIDLSNPNEFFANGIVDWCGHADVPKLPINLRPLKPETVRNMSRTRVARGQFYILHHGIRTFNGADIPCWYFGRIHRWPHDRFEADFFDVEWATTQTPDNPVPRSISLFEMDNDYVLESHTLLPGDVGGDNRWWTLLSYVPPQDAHTITIPFTDIPFANLAPFTTRAAALAAGDW